MLERTNPVPIHFELGNHEIDNLAFLLPFEQKAKEYLNNTSSGRLMVAYEVANFDLAASDGVSLFVMNGDLPSNAFARVKFMNNKGYLPDAIEFEECRLSYERDAFTQNYIKILDDLVIEYPGRIHLVPEWAPIEELVESKKELKTVERVNEFIRSGKLKKAFPLFQAHVQNEAVSLAKRDRRYAETIEAEILNNNDIIGVIGFWGASHTGIIHNLRRKGYEATYSFPEREGGVYCYEPYAAAVRTLRFFPEAEYSTEAYRRNFFLSICYNVLYVLEAARSRSLRNGVEAPSNQNIIDLIYGDLGDINLKEIEKFEKTAKRHGLIKALEQLI